MLEIIYIQMISTDFNFFSADVNKLKDFNIMTVFKV